MKPVTAFLKRTFDFCLALSGLLVFVPLMGVIALLIKAGDRGPLLYIQNRWGKDGKRVKTYKFRTMIPNADPPGSMKPAVEYDPRVTPFGNFLRATALDELPQLVNILKGDMSFVGPRALAVEEISQSSPGFQERHSVRPGLTGPAQIYVSRDARFQEKLAYDLDYIKHLSMLKDLKLILLSVWITLRGRWENRGKKL